MTDPVNFLLVDDLEENLLSLEALLQRDGLSFLKARSGDEALELLLKHDVALALLDVQMPGMDGFQLAEFMRGSERDAAHPDHLPHRRAPPTASAASAAMRPARSTSSRSRSSRTSCAARPTSSSTCISSGARSLRSATRWKTAAQALKHADRRKNEFLAVLGHELRNPIAALNAGLQLLRKQASTERADLLHEKMERQVVHLSRLIEDLLDISRITRARSRWKQEIELATLVHSAVEASQSADRGRGTQLHPRASGRTDLAPRRPHPHGAGDHQPAQQRRQVHAGGRGDQACGAMQRKPGGDRGLRQRHRHSARDAVANFSDLRPDRRPSGSGIGGPRHRSRAGAEAGPASRRSDCGRRARDRTKARPSRSPSRSRRPVPAEPRQRRSAPQIDRRALCHGRGRG